MGFYALTFSSNDRVEVSTFNELPAYSAVAQLARHKVTARSLWFYKV